MIFFFADNHYGVHPGKNIFEHLPARIGNQISFSEDDWSILEKGEWEKSCELLVLNMIGDTCGIPHPGADAERAVRKYVERGGNTLLLHGSSAAFWKWEWWRPLAGFRWVRPEDPDGFEPSTHPNAPCSVRIVKTRHPLAKSLRDFSMPADEIYIHLEQTAPASILMETVIDQGTFPQVCECRNQFGGTFLSIIPGHAPESTSQPGLLANIETAVDYLLRRNA